MSRTPSKLSSPGPYLAEVTNHLDNSFMGGLEVILKTRIPGQISDKANTYPVKYMTPFYGVTSHRFLGNNDTKFSDTQKSYGMWMVPPDVGTTVMIIFVDSDPNQGYWIGCVPDLFQNHMVPGIGSSANFQKSDSAYKNAAALPVAEFNKKSPNTPDNIDSVKRPVHPFADVLLNQGLILDNIRGVTSSSARRERPSMVFGISTPGPLDLAGPRNKIGYSGNTTMPTSRLGGSTFVMDDGDLDGNNELVRIRTRTGHQILLHNTADLIYIANSKGTAWLEFTSDGKIDIYAADSVSIHTEGDFNLKADRDFNLQSGRDFNILAGRDLNLNANSDLNSIGANVLTHTIGDHILTVGSDHSLSIGGNSSQLTTGRISIVSEESVAVESNNEISLKSKETIALDSALTKQYTGSSSVKSIEPAYDIPDGINLFNAVDSTSDDHAPSSNSSAMVRVPMKEPWGQHENLNQSAFSLSNTDVNGGGVTSKDLTSVQTAGSQRTTTALIAAAPSAKISKSRPGVDVGTSGTSTLPWTTDKPFLTKIKSIASSLKIKPIDLVAAMNLETRRTFNPAIRNPKSSATGLIQFLEDTANELGTTTAKLSYMSRNDQMEYVEKYFKKWGWPSKLPSPTLSNVYLTIFLPKYRFESDDFVLSRKGEAYYEKNTVFDPGRKLGYFTVGMVSKAANSYKKDAIETLKNAGLDENLEPKT